MWRDELEKVKQYYFLAHHYQSIDSKSYQKYISAYQHHLKKYVDLFEKKNALHESVPIQAKRARVRFLHAAIVAARQPIDIYIDGKLVATITYLTPNPHLSISTGKHRVVLYPSRQTTNPIWKQEVTVGAGKRYLFVVANKNKNPADGIQLISYAEAETVPADKVKLRFIHLSPDAPSLDVKENQRNVSFSAVTYKESTSYATTTLGRTNISVRIAGTEDQIASIAFDTTARHAYTLIAAGEANNPYWLLLLDQ